MDRLRDYDGAAAAATVGNFSPPHSRPILARNTVAHRRAFL